MWAREKRRQRDETYGVRFDIEPWHMRHMGEAGERCFRGWLKREAIPHEWIDENPARSPDFAVAGNAIDVKVASRHVAARAEWSQSITAERAHESYIDWFFLMTYCIPARTLTFMGGITREDVVRCGRYCPAGTAIHAKYTVADNHEVYDVDYRLLVSPREFLSAALSRELTTTGMPAQGLL